MELRTRALQVRLIADPQGRAQAAREVRAASSSADPGDLDLAAVLTPAVEPPGRPERPRLLAAVKVASRSPFTPEGRAGERRAA